MAKSGSEDSNCRGVPKIDSLPNLRVLCRLTNACSAPDQNSRNGIFRSSKPDRISADDLSEFRRLGIKCIIDFRSKDEYMGTDGHCPLDKEYSLFSVLVPSKNYLPGESVKYKCLSKSEHEKKDDNPKQPLLKDDQNDEYRHFLINFFKSNLIITLFNRLSWHLWFYGIFVLFCDLVRRNKMRNFVNFFVKHTINVRGILGQYTDIVELSQPSICSALKLAADPANLPVMINCAHGKDRTGIVSALILTCLGMSKEYVAEEYALSTKGLEPVKHLVYKDIVEKFKFKEEFVGAEAETMRGLLTYIEEKYGSVENYMVHIGFGLEEQRKLRENLEAYEHFDLPSGSSSLSKEKSGEN